MIDLRHRTRIFVPDAACLLGIVDETGSLPPGQVTIPSVGWTLFLCAEELLSRGDLNGCPKRIFIFFSFSLDAGLLLLGATRWDPCTRLQKP